MKNFQVSLDLFIRTDKALLLFNCFILVANKTVGTECPVGNNVDPDSADVGEAMCKQKTFSCLKSTK